MLPSLYIKNYRNLEELTINTLARVNLIAGKNNTGKTSILEAISIYANRGSMNNLIQILEKRGEYSRAYRNSREREEMRDLNLKFFASIFPHRKWSFDKNAAILIGSASNKDQLEFKFIQFLIEDIEEDGSKFRRRRIIEDVEDNPIDARMGFALKFNDSSQIIALDGDLDLYIRRELSEIKNIQFIHTNNIDRDVNAVLFDQVALSEMESYLIEALQIIEPRTERIAFIESNRKSRSAVVKLSGVDGVVPIGSMGDGINRILTIILALVNSSDGYLLIDEFENGLHYTVQDQLWEIVFKLAVDLNIQVFATTHSNDCISSFTRILNKKLNKDLGKYIRLDNVNGIVKEVSYAPNELEIADAQKIEVR